MWIWSKCEPFFWEERELGTILHEMPIPSDMENEANQARDYLIEKLSDFDDVLMDKYLSGQFIDVVDIKRVIRKATIKNDFVPGFVRISF